MNILIVLISFVLTAAAEPEIESEFFYQFWNLDQRSEAKFKEWPKEAAAMRGVLARSDSTHSRVYTETIKNLTADPKVKFLGETVFVHLSPDNCKVNGRPVDGIADEDCQFFLFEHIFKFELDSAQQSVVAFGVGHGSKATGEVIEAEVDHFEVRFSKP